MKKRKQEKVLYAREAMAIYLSYVKQHKFRYIIICIGMPLSVLFFNTFVPYFLSVAIGNLADGIATQRALIYAVVATIVGFILNFFIFRLTVKTEATITRDIADDIAQQILDKDYTFFTNQKVGALTSKFNEFVYGFVALQDLIVLKTIGTLLTFFVGIVLLARQSLLLAGVLFIFIIVLGVIIRLGLIIRTPYRSERKYLKSAITGEVADSITNSLVVKTFSNERREIHNLKLKTEKLRKLYTSDITIAVTEGSIRQLLTSSVQVGAIILAIFQVKSGALDIGAAVFALAYLQRVSAQVFQLGEIVNGYDRLFLDSAPMTEILLSKNSIVDLPTAKSLVIDEASVTFSGVSYVYSDVKDKKDTAIDTFDLSLEGGKKYGIVGRSGSGKTTLTRILLRFDDVTRGSIEIDYQDIRMVTQSSLRKAIAYVPQEPMLFHRALAENIAYGKPDATQQEIESAAKMAHAHEFIKTLPKGYQTIVGERGVKLSGGQRQRIAIARAILKNSPILVLDEATSALDSESEKLIQDALKKLMVNKTTIVIAHRLSTIQKMDEIIVMDKGKIIEKGPHAKLIKQDGTYAKLWAHQSGGFIK